MSEIIKRIDYIRNMASFDNFEWHGANGAGDKGNTKSFFSKINIFYGRNASGKTTLSRILRAFELGAISDKFSQAEFKITFDREDNKQNPPQNATFLTEKSLNSHTSLFKVFNEDFVKENLKFINNENESINSFAILGKDNTALEEEIEYIKKKLGSEEKKVGLLWERRCNNEIYNNKLKQFNDTKTALERNLKSKANDEVIGIKRKPYSPDHNYNATKLRKDIESLGEEFEKYILSEDDERTHHDKIEEKAKILPNILTVKELRLEQIAHEAKILIETAISPSESIQELLNDHILSEWVKQGRAIHQNNRDNCAFCGSIIPDNLLKKIDLHFNKESEELSTRIDQLKEKISLEISRHSAPLDINMDAFYDHQTHAVLDIQKNYDIFISDYEKSLNKIVLQLEARKELIFVKRNFEENYTFNRTTFDNISKQYAQLCAESIHYTKNIDRTKNESKRALLHSDIAKYIKESAYFENKNNIAQLEADTDEAKTKLDASKTSIKKLEQDIINLENRLKDESEGANKVNHFLNNHFGFQHLTLKAIENEGENSGSRFRFEVMRGNKKAYNLSEGECTLIAFCYFMAKLSEASIAAQKPIIWIDDPICSLDENHIFYIYSLIATELIDSSKEKNDIDRLKFSQVFISTHNLDFLKYLSKFGVEIADLVRNFVVNKGGTKSNEASSTIKQMPSYLKKYTTEFIHLFNEVYLCAHQPDRADFYNYCNNARKFLEMYLFYKYPNIALSEGIKFSRFFGNDNAANQCITRMNHEFSHACGVFERVSRPVERAEMGIAAKFILRKIKEKDPEQYRELLHNIKKDLSVEDKNMLSDNQQKAHPSHQSHPTQPTNSQIVTRNETDGIFNTYDQTPQE